jgi:choline kinase
MQPYTHELPKCMLQFEGLPLIDYALKGLQGAGCEEITIVTGHLADQIPASGCRRVYNADYENNNILHSLMYARDCFDDSLLVTYSDILVNPIVYKSLAACPGDIVTVVDKDWEAYYAGRTHHPSSEAEKAFIEPDGDHAGRVKVMGKHLNPVTAAAELCAEFLGLWKMTAAGAKRFRAHFESVDAKLTPLSPFQTAKEWRKAYVTDFLTDLIDSGTAVHCLVIERGWAEIDTVQDYERLPAIAARQRLFREGSDHGD